MNVGGLLVGVVLTIRVGTLVGVRVPIRVEVGKAVRNAVAVRVGILVTGAVSVSRLCTGTVAVPSRVRVGTGVKVLLGVKVGVAETSGVLVGVEEAVLVGMVWVGKGPSRACAVPARAVLIASMPCGPVPRPETLELLNVTT